MFVQQLITTLAGRTLNLQNTQSREVLVRQDF
jgi:hypothetical protein